MIRKAFQSLFAGRSSPLSAKETDQVNEALAKTKLRMGPHFKKNQILGQREAIILRKSFATISDPKP